MRARRERLLYLTTREGLFLAVAGLGSVVFIQHGLLYLGPSPVLRIVPPTAYVLVTVILYAFLRSVVVLSHMRAPRVHPSLERCPECGQPLDDGTPKGVEAHRQIPLTPKPTRSEILAAVALHKAIDEARAVAARNLDAYEPSTVRLPGDIENAPLLPRDRPPVREPLVIRRTLKTPDRPKGPS